MTNKAILVKNILAGVGCDKLALHKGDGYWYFEYDDPARNIFETESVYVVRLRQQTLSQWIDLAKDFIATVEENAQSRNAAAQDGVLRISIKTFP